MCKQQQLPTPAASPVVQDRKESPAGVVFQSCGLDRSCPTSVTTPQGQGVRLDQYQSSIKRRRRRTRSSIGIVPDHDFEWYDLDAIREADSCDFRAGLVFTTERQVLNNGVEVNSINPSVVVDETTNTKDRTKDRQDNFDLFFWVNHHDHNKVEETAAEKEEREFRERMEELEEEIMSHDSSSSSSSSSSSLSGSFRSSSSSETKHEGDDWI